MPYNGTYFTSIVCMLPDNQNSDHYKIVNNLYSKLLWFTNSTINFDWLSNTDRKCLPFFSRNILETVATLLLIKVDPFRVFSVYKVQIDPSYTINKRSIIALEWGKDILSSDSKPNPLWGFDIKKDNFSRALLSAHSADLFWKPAFVDLTDYIVANGISSTWVNELMLQTEEEFYQRSLSSASRLFSSFSKGVHSECLVDTSNVFDDVTLKNLIIEMFKLCANLSLVSHFITCVSSIADKAQLFSNYMEVEEMISNGIR